MVLCLLPCIGMSRMPHAFICMCITMVVMNIDMLCGSIGVFIYLSVWMYVCDNTWKHTQKSYTLRHARTHTVSLSPLIFVCIGISLVRTCKSLCLCVDELPNKPNVFWNGTCIPWCSLTLKTATTIKNSARLCNDSYRIPSFVRALYW